MTDEAESTTAFGGDQKGDILAKMPEADITQPFYTHYQDLWDRTGAAFWADMYAEAGIERKSLELIVVGCLALRGFKAGLINHTLLALRYGNTPKEIRGAILITLATGGWASMMPGLAWADEILVPFERGELKLEDIYDDM